MAQMSSTSLSRHPQTPTSAAYIFQYLYLLWAPLWFIAYLETTYELFPAPTPVTGAGLAARVAALVLAALLPLPNWVGAALAARFRRRGDGPAATVALLWNVLVGVLILGGLLVFGGIGLAPA